MTDIRDHLADELHGMLTAPDKRDQQAHAKKMFLMLWGFFPQPVQDAFRAYVNKKEELDFLPVWDGVPKEWNEAAKWWGYLGSSSYSLPNDQRAFWHTIKELIRHRRPPSEKQAAWMLAMVSDYRRWKDAEEMEVVE